MSAARTPSPSTRANVLACARRLLAGSVDGPWTDEDRDAALRALLDHGDGVAAVEDELRRAAPSWSGSDAFRAFVDDLARRG